MGRNRIKWAWMLATALAVMGFVSGCAGQPKQSEARKMARERWADARSKIMFAMAKQQFENGELDKADKTITEAISINATQAPYYDLAARILMERGQLERAYNTVGHSIELDAKRTESHYLMGVIEQRWQRYEAALEQYDTAYQCTPDDVAPLLAAAEMLVKLDRTDEAIKRLEEKRSYFENNAGLRVSLGRMYLLKRDMANATARFKEAALLAPEDMSIIEQLAMAEYADSQWADAIFHLTKLLGDPAFSDRSELKMALGDCYMATSKPVEARRVFMDLTRENPNDVNAWVKLAESAWTVGDAVRLNEAAARVQALAPERSEGYLLRGMILMRDGRSQEAIAWFDKAGQLASTNAMPWILKGITQERMGDKHAAAESYRQALRVAPNDARAQRLLVGVNE
ncbi:MAG: tetratricopeptide repeat protein [Planctomycetes bacterium]|nr:tetratricopeptide repeat protein [Planctomycetota bacterium]